MSTQSQRPTGVTVVSSLLMLLGGLGVVVIGIGFQHLAAKEALSGFFGSAWLLLCGIAMWRGHNWGRWLYVLFEPAWMIAEGLITGFEPEQLTGLGLYAIVVFVITRPAATRFFGTTLFLRDEPAEDGPARPPQPSEPEPQPRGDEPGEHGGTNPWSRMTVGSAVVAGIVGGLSVVIPDIVDELSSESSGTPRAFESCNVGEALSLVKDDDLLGTALDGDGRTPLHHAAMEGCPELAGALIERGADVGARDAHQRTPLHLAADDAGAETVELLVDRGAKAGAADEDGRTPLFEVAASGETGKAKRLAASLEVINRKSDDGWAPLHRAAKFAPPEMVRTLLEQGADPDLRGPGGQTPLHLAARSDNATAVTRVLLEHGASPDATDRRGRTAADLARHTDNAELQALVERYEGK